MRILYKYRFDCYALLSLPFWYLLSTKLFYNSDFALGYVAGQDFLNGNILLRGWAIGNDSFFTTDLFWQALLYSITRDMLLSAHLFSIITICLLYHILWRLLFLLTDEIHRASVLPELFFLMCSLAFLAMRAWIFFTPGRGMTIAFSLLAVGLYYRKQLATFGKLLIILFATLAMAGDKYAWAYLALPLTLLWMWQCLRSRKYEKRIFYIITAMVMTLALRLLFKHCAFSVPGFYTPLAFADFSRVSYNFYCYAGSIFQLVSAWFWGESLANIVWLRHFAFAILLVLLLVGYLPRSWSGSRLGKFLALSAASVSATCIVLNLALPGEFNLARYQTCVIINALPLSAHLAMRSFSPLPDSRLLNGFIACAAFSIIGLAANFLPADPRIAQAQELARVLEAKGQHAGYGQFWAATSTSFYGGGRPEIYPVNFEEGNFRRYYWMTRKNGFFDRNATFIVHDKKVANTHFDTKNVDAIFGKPAEHFSVGDYEVWLYDHTLNNYLQN